MPRPPTAVALLPEEKPGKIFTASPGAVSIEATFCGPPGETLPPPPLPDPGPSARYHALRHEADGEERGIFCEVRATRPADLALAVDGLLRALSAYAALAGAVFEARAVRLSEPLVSDALIVGRLARHFSSCGLGVSFGRSPAPAPEGAAVCVGASGRERQISRFLREHPAWHPIPL